MKLGLQIVLGILSLIPIFFGVTGLLYGADQLMPEGQSVPPALDNQFRYWAGFYFILAFVLWWVIPNIERHTTLLRIVCMALVIGGLKPTTDFVVTTSIFAIGFPTAGINHRAQTCSSAAGQTSPLMCPELRSLPSSQELASGCTRSQGRHKTKRSPDIRFSSSRTPNSTSTSP